jgi:NAD(P)-dependent dehydrogenase (short-subunit alcohol dehydrogenase family)
MASCVLVTGTSRGIGAAVADELLSRGVRVFGISRTPHASLNAHGLFTHVQSDLADRNDVQIAWKRVEHLVTEHQGILNGLVNAAGGCTAGSALQLHLLSCDAPQVSPTVD